MGKRSLSDPFLYLPCNKTFPDYYTTIEKPMSLTCIKNKIDDSKVLIWNIIVHYLFYDLSTKILMKCFGIWKQCAKMPAAITELAHKSTMTRPFSSRWLLAACKCAPADQPCFIRSGDRTSAGRSSLLSRKSITVCRLSNKRKFFKEKPI